MEGAGSEMGDGTISSQRKKGFSGLGGDGSEDIEGTLAGVGIGGRDETNNGTVESIESP
jgi:hypothetical protein